MDSKRYYHKCAFQKYICHCEEPSSKGKYTMMMYAFDNEEIYKQFLQNLPNFIESYEKNKEYLPTFSEH
jgi:hypothetical protein